MTESQTAQLGKIAERLKENDAYIAAIKAMHDQINLQWKNTPLRDTEGLMAISQLSRCADIFESNLSGLIEAGKFAQNKINLDNARNESGVKRFLRRA